MKYVIQKGDTLWAIARANGTTVNEIAQANNISNPNLIYAGTEIEIPDGGSSGSGSSGSSGASSASGDYSATATTDPSYSSTKPTYTASEKGTAAEKELEKWENSAPAEYESAWSDRINALVEELLGRGEFTYDASADPIYNHYRDKYITEGRRAMEDAKGSASALTGGYGNSYAETVANAAYNQYLSELGDVIPSLAQAAYERYSDSLNGRREDIEMLLGFDETDYSRYRDSVDDYNNLGKYLYEKYTDISDADYKKYLSDLDQWNADRDYERDVYEYEQDAAYRRERDAAEDAQWQKEQDLAWYKATKPTTTAPSNKNESADDKDTANDKDNADADDGEEFGYWNCGTTARGLMDTLMNSAIYDSEGHLTSETIDMLVQYKKSGKITADEYNYIRSTLEKGYK